LWFRLVAKRSTWGRSHRTATESNTTCVVPTLCWLDCGSETDNLPVHWRSLEYAWLPDECVIEDKEEFLCKEEREHDSEFLLDSASRPLLLYCPSLALLLSKLEVLKCYNANMTALISNKLMCSCCWTRDHTPDTDFPSRKAPHPWRLESV
jgi:hypothetical protein